MGIDASLTARQRITNRFGDPMTITDDFDLHVRGQDALDVVDSDNPQQTYYNLVWARGEGNDEPDYVCDDYEEHVDMMLGEINWEDTKTGYIKTFNINRDHAREFWDWCEARKDEGYELIFDTY